MGPDADRALVERLRGSSKYRWLCEDILHWSVRTARRQAQSDKEVLKVAKRKLHQAYGSFLGDARRKRALRALEAAGRLGSAEPGYREQLSLALSLHASTAERAQHLDAVWRWIREQVGEASKWLDVGCGMAPAALPWSGLPTTVEYVGLDLDPGLCAALEGALRDGWPFVRIFAADARKAELPTADVALLFKLLPTLERQESGAAKALVRRLDAPVVVATFPTQSLGGRGLGADAYLRFADAVLGPGPTTHIGGELLRLVRAA